MRGKKYAQLNDSCFSSHTSETMTDSGWGGELNLLADVEERQVIFAVLDSFR
jgi:hypothetical protein